jgi:hypothetical protein
MNKFIKKIDWIQVGVLALGITASLARTLYENKKFDENLTKRSNEHFDKKVNELIDQKLQKLKK